MSKDAQHPLIGPRNASQQERLAYQAKDLFMHSETAYLGAAGALALAAVGKMVLKTDTIQISSVKKLVQSFVVISLGFIGAQQIMIMKK